MGKKYRHVFVLGTGRNGSLSFARACENIRNYSSGHESRLGMSAAAKLDYPDHHIESDNRLSWLLGRLAERFPEDVFYVHLTRATDDVAKSYNRRWHIANGIMTAYAQGILNMPLSDNTLLTVEDYVETVNANVTEFLKDKPMMHIDMAHFDTQFSELWDEIQAEGDMQAAIDAFHTVANSGQSKARFNHLSYSFKKLLDGLRRGTASSSDGSRGDTCGP